jgi:hypothetical protein
MRKLILVRTVLALIGVAIWGYGYRYDMPDVRLAAIGILAISLVLRFLPKRWFGAERAP